MRRLALATALLALCSAAPLAAQGGAPPDSSARRGGVPPLPASPNDSIFRRAKRLVSAGNGVAGRALVDSLLSRAPEGTSDYGDALYWHGALAETAAEAERTYRRVIVEYPISLYSDDALLALAELEQARGDRAGALAHLQRFVREHPQSPGRAVAAFAAARLAFEQRDTRTACAMIAEARTSASNTDVELRNQIDYYAGRCPATVDRVPAPIPAAVPVEPAPEPAVVEKPAGRTVPRSDVQAVAKPAATPAVKPAAKPVATPTPTPTHTAKTAMKPPAPVPALTLRRDSVPSASATARKPSGPGRGSYTIQLAAYNTRADAEQLVKKLAAKGVRARISGRAKPFRVRLDFYSTRAAAANEVAALRARGIIGFVTTEPVEGKGP